jgi:hypothetical protein
MKPLCISLVTDADGFGGGGGKSPQSICPAKAEEASANVRTMITQSWGGCFISFLLKRWLRVAAGDEAANQ